MAIIRKQLQKGFTIVEMLIVVAIVAIVATILLFNYSDFSTGIGLRDLAEEIGLSVRKAQTYATSVRSVPGTNGVTTDAFPAYGMSFSVNSSGVIDDPTSTNLVLFADVSAAGTNGQTDDLYENGGVCGNPSFNSECLETLGIQDGDTITSLCTAQTGSQTCMTTSGTVNVVFRRPNPDAEIYVVGNSQPQSYLYITVTSPKGLTRQIKIYATGQISVQ